MNRTARTVATALVAALATLTASGPVTAGPRPGAIPRAELVFVRAEAGATVTDGDVMSVLQQGGPVERVPALDLPDVGWTAYWTKGKTGVLPSGMSQIAGVERAWRDVTWQLPPGELAPRPRLEPMAAQGGGVTDPTDEPFWAQLWNLRAMGAYPDGWNVATGYQSIVGVIDSGVDCGHVDLACTMGDHYDATHRVVVGWPTDRLGHGTHVAGIIAAHENGRGVMGVAPDAEITSCKACSDGGTCSEADVAACVVWLVPSGVSVINMSLGGSYGALTPQLCEVLEWARAEGDVASVASVGNGGGRQDLYPATCPGVIGVAASIPPDGDRLADYSQRASVDITAPGSDVLSTLPSDRWGYLSGTSMAAPHVSGAMALMRQAMDDQWDPSLAARYLYDNARRICGPVYQQNLCGWGALDVNAAVRAWMPVVATLPPPSAATSSVTPPATWTAEPTPTVEPTRTHIPAVQTAIAELTLTAVPPTPSDTPEPVETTPLTATLTATPLWPTWTPTPSPTITPTLDAVALTVTALWPTNTPDVPGTLTAIAPTADWVATAVWATLRAPHARETREASRRKLFFPLLVDDPPPPPTLTPTPGPDACESGFPWECPQKTFEAVATQKIGTVVAATEEAHATFWATFTATTPTAVWPLHRWLPMTKPGYNRGGRSTADRRPHEPA